MQPVIEKTDQKISGNGHHKEPLTLGPPPPPPESPSEEPPGKPPQPDKTGWVGPFSWVIAILVLITYIFWPRPELPAEALDAVDARRALGPADAPITLILYSDFGCPVCRNIQASGVLNETLAAYPDQLRIVWRDFPMAPQSPKAAEAALCASDQAQFWAYHDRLFQNLSAHSPEDLVGYAQDIGLDQTLFDECLTSARHRPEVARDMRAARRTDRSAPPVFVLDGQVRYVGQPQLADLQTIIDRALSDQ